MTERDLRTLGPKPAVKKAKKKPDIQAEPPAAWQLKCQTWPEGPSLDAWCLEQWDPQVSSWQKMSGLPWRQYKKESLFWEMQDTFEGGKTVLNTINGVINAKVSAC